MDSFASVQSHGIVVNLSKTEKDCANEVIRYLLKNSYILKNKFNMDSLDYERDTNPIWIKCSNNERLINDILSIFDISMVRSNSYDIYYLAGENIDPIKPGITCIKMALLIRYIYGEKSDNFYQRDIYFTKKELREKGDITGLLKDKITDIEWNRVLTFLKEHTLVTYKGNVSDLDDDSKIYIYPTILLFLNPNVINNVENILFPDDTKEDAKNETVGIIEELEDVVNE